MVVFRAGIGSQRAFLSHFCAFLLQILLPCCGDPHTVLMPLDLILMNSVGSDLSVAHHLPWYTFLPQKCVQCLYALLVRSCS